MPVTIPRPDPLDLADERLAVGDKGAAVTKMNSAWDKLETWQVSLSAMIDAFESAANDLTVFYASVEGDLFASGTTALFAQAAAPVGWTQVTSLDDAALRVVSGTGGSSGGTYGFTTAFSSSRTVSGSVGNTVATGTIGSTTAGGSITGSVSSATLATSQIPSHDHPQRGYPELGNAGYQPSGAGAPTTITYSVPTGLTGGGGSHTHGNTFGFSGAAHNHTFSGAAHNHTVTASVNLAVKYLNIIQCSKD